MNADRAVLVGFIVVVGVGGLRDVRSGRAFTSDIVARRLFGAFVGAILLILIGRVAPRVATGLVVLSVLATLTASPEALEGLFARREEPADSGNTEGANRGTGGRVRSGRKRQ